MSESDRPFVSVIVPVFNEQDAIRDCLDALTNQSYPEDSYEVIVVDNGSTDQTKEIIESFDVVLHEETEQQGSYAARNRGIEQALGDVIAFTDADCRPEPTWIESGIKTLDSEDAAIVGGRIRFSFSEAKTAAERFDASVNMRNDESAKEGIVKTANAFVRRDVIETIGPFPAHLQSGGDVYWSQSASEAGFEVIYAPHAIVDHPSRKLRELLRKQYRVGVGQVEIWRIDGQSAVLTLLTGLLQFPAKVLRFLFAKGSDSTRDRTPEDRNVERGVGFVCVAILCILVTNIGRVIGIAHSGRS